MARALFEKNKILIITGRSEICRQTTVEWLRKYRILHSGIYMRKDGDHREDSVVKSELLDQVIREHSVNTNTNILAGVFEDRQQVVDMYRARGFRVFQVAKGDF